MLKKKMFFFVMMILFCCNKRYATAGDAFHDICVNREPQDALLIGNVEQIEPDGIWNIEILRVICGTVEESHIKYYNPAVNNISVGTYVLLSVEKEKDIYKKCFSVCHEVTIAKTDKIADIRPLDQEKDEEWEISLQWFCNTGTTIGDATDSGKYYQTLDDGISQTLVYDRGEHIWYKDPLSSEYPSPNTAKPNITEYVFLGMFLSTAFIFLLCLGVYRNKQDQDEL